MVQMSSTLVAPWR